MNKPVHSFRLLIFFVCLILAAAVCVLTIYELQVVRASEYENLRQGTVTTESVIHAARGNIYDRNGKLLVSNRAVYSIYIDRDLLLNSASPNEDLLAISDILEDFGQPFTDTLPITSSAPYAYTAMDETQSSRLTEYFDFFGFSADTSAEELMAFFLDHYDIPDGFSSDQARTAIGLRYELEMRVILSEPALYISDDAGTELISVLKELGLDCIGVDTSYIREYHTDYAAHLLGYVGPMDDDEYAYYSENYGYSLDALVGQEGVEQAFEEYLHGTDGKLQITTTEDGTITNVEYLSEPVPGNNVYLTVDISLQEVAENILSSTIESINAERQQQLDDIANGTTVLDEDERDIELISGGAVVVMDPSSFEVLSCVSYPTFDLEDFEANYSELANDPSSPLINRALQGIYSPGSTFKMVTAIASLQNGIITPEDTIYDTGIYTEYIGDGFTCWVYPYSHGTLNVTSALENSCNYFFYSVGDKLGIDKLSAFARQFGFGSSTGIELYEEYGIVANREYKETEIGETWWPGDTLQAAIGQSYNLFTPIQMAAYTSTLANGGDRYAAHLLNYVKTYDYSQIIYDYEPELLNHIEADDEYIDIAREGMLAVSQSGTASDIFGGYFVEVAAKTGTVQTSETGTNDGVFICFAPYDDPEIAISVVIEKGGSGAAIARIAKEIMDYYFSVGEYQNNLVGENTLRK